jgi:hypothetical protein
MREPNCRHTKWGIFLGQAPLMTEEQLAQLDKDVVFNGKTYTAYEATQKQRAMERDIRQSKRRIAALEAAGIDTTEAQAKLKAQNKAYREFTKQTGMLLQRERTLIPVTGNLTAGVPGGIKKQS